MSYSSTLKPGENALTTELIGRRIAYPFAVFAQKRGISANTVTVIAGGCWMLSLPLPFLAGVAYEYARYGLSMSLWFLAGFLWNAGYILDMADGSLARMTGTASKRGYYLDHVFHLLFKPAFLASVGLGLCNMCQGSWPGPVFVILLVIASIPANWSATQNAVEHVLCETVGKGGKEPQLSESDFRKLWLGTNEINDTAADKRSVPARLMKTFVLEVFSYYGQFTFFSMTVLVDILRFYIFTEKNGSFHLTKLAFVFIVVVLFIRIPFRVYREYKQATLLDTTDNNENKNNLDTNNQIH